MSENREIPSCSICMEHFKHDGERCPRTLKECGHTFCSGCINGLIKEDSIQCAICRKETELPNNGIEGLNKAFALLDLIAEDNDSKNDNSKSEKPKEMNQKSNSKSSSSSKPAKFPETKLSLEHAKSLKNDEFNDLLITLQTPIGQRAPVDVCCVVDISGSMSVEAKLKTESGKTETDGLTILDIVKHAVKTVTKLLTDQDRISIVHYASRAGVTHALSAATKNTQDIAIAALEKLQPNGATNLWAGLKLGLEQLGGDDQSRRAKAVFLLTDGQPNCEPARGHIGALKGFQKQNPNSAPIWTFGFGYDIDSKLLIDLATKGRGSYSFIPDSSMIGSAFVNAISTLLTTAGQQAQLKIDLNNSTFDKSSLDCFDGELNAKQTQAIVNIRCGLISGVEKHVLLRVKKGKDSSVKVSLNYRPTISRTQPKQVDVIENYSFNDDNDTVSIDLKRQRARFDLIEAMLAELEAAGKGTDAGVLKNSVVVFDKLAETMSNDANDDEYVKAVRADLSGQVREAFSRQDWYRRWGRHYVPSLASSHLAEICGNFKDPGLQAYASDLFSTLQEVGDEVFCAMPPPQPAPPPPEVVRAMGANYQPAPRRQVNMARYHNSHGPCVAADSRVTLANGTTKRADALQRGDVLLVPATLGRAATTAPVDCVVLTRFQSNSHVKLCAIGSLRVTPWHPVQLDSRQAWQFPSTLASTRPHRCEQGVVSLLLGATHDGLYARAPAFRAENVSVAAFAHGVDDDAVLSHEFFGSQRVVDCLVDLKGFEHGRVLLQDNCIVRGNDGLVCALKQ